MQWMVAYLVSVNIRDNGGEFRIEIAGSLAGSVVDDVLFAWSAALREDASRRIVVDITQLAGYDFQGCSLLQDMHYHGTQIAAGSPQSLVFPQAENRLHFQKGLLAVVIARK